MRLFLIIIFTIAIIFAIIAFQNNLEISVQFIKWTYTGPLALVLLVPFAVGLAAGITTLLPPLWKQARTARSYKKRVQELEMPQEDSVEAEHAEEPEEDDVQNTEEDAAEEKKPDEQETT